MEAEAAKASSFYLPGAAEYIELQHIIDDYYKRHKGRP